MNLSKAFIFSLLVFSSNMLFGEDAGIAVAKTWVKERYAEYTDVDEIVQRFLNRRKDLELPENKATRATDRQTAKEFRAWVKKNQVQVVFSDKNVVALLYYDYNSMSGHDLQKKPLVFIREAGKWNEFNNEIVKIRVFDLNGDGKPDLFYELGCCGRRAVGALLTSATESPVDTGTIGWTELAPPPTEAIGSCDENRIPDHTTFEPVSSVYKACRNFQISLAFHHCKKKRTAIVDFDCNTRQFVRRVKPL